MVKLVFQRELQMIHHHLQNGSFWSPPWNSWFWIHSQRFFVTLSSPSAPNGHQHRNYCYSRQILAFHLHGNGFVLPSLLGWGKTSHITVANPIITVGCLIYSPDHSQMVRLLIKLNTVSPRLPLPQGIHLVPLHLWLPCLPLPSPWSPLIASAGPEEEIPGTWLVIGQRSSICAWRSINILSIVY